MSALVRLSRRAAEDRDRQDPALQIALADAGVRLLSPSRELELGSGLLEEAVRVSAKELLPPPGVEARPGEGIVDRVRELAFRVRIIGGVHQHVVTEKSGDGVEHVLSLLSLDAAEKAAARNVFARSMFERRGAADIDRLLIHAPRPERQP